MILSVERLCWNCGVCGERADFRIVRTNDELPKGFVQRGARSLYYCASDLPIDAKQQFQFAEGSEPHVERYAFRDSRLDNLPVAH